MQAVGPPWQNAVPATEPLQEQSALPFLPQIRSMVSTRQSPWFVASRHFFRRQMPVQPMAVGAGPSAPAGGTRVRVREARYHLFQFRQEHHALLLPGVRSRDDGDERLGRADVDREVRNAGWDVVEVSGSHGDSPPQSRSESRLRDPRQHVERGLVPAVHVGVTPPARRNRHQVEAETPRPNRLG